MVRPGPLPFVLLLSLSGWAPLVAGEAAKPKPKPTPTPTATPAAKKPEKRVFTNDDLEASRDKPSAVQDLTAVGMPPPPVAPIVGSQPAREEPPAEDPGAEDRRRVKEAEEQVKALDDQANQLLWLYLQSTDTNEILRLKAEQQEVLDRLKEAKAELERLKGLAGSDTPVPTPTREPG